MQEEDEEDSALFAGPWDMNTLAETITNTVSEGITSIATNITGWVADLASAFDAGWGDEDEEEQQ